MKEVNIEIPSAELPNARPVGIRAPRSWRVHHLPRFAPTPNQLIVVLGLDERFGVIVVATIKHDQMFYNRRRNSTHIQFQTDLPKTHITINCISGSWGADTPKRLQDMLIARQNSFETTLGFQRPASDSASPQVVNAFTAFDGLTGRCAV